LNLHAYTQRKDKRDQFSVTSAAGMMVGVGNVGRYLSTYSEARTFMTVDAGVSWREIADDAYMYEIADSGNILVFVNDEEPTDKLK
jgi:hypothetical protein